MTEQQEILSALMDDEATEIEIHKLVRQFDSSADVKRSWFHWQQIRARGQGVNELLSPDQQLALNQRIIAATSELDFANSDAAPAKTENKKFADTYRYPLTGLAMAASLVLAVFVGFQLGTTNVVPNADGGQPTLAQSPSAPIVVQPVRMAGGVPAVAPAGVVAADFDSELKALNNEDRERLRAYLHQHDRLSRIKTNARFVTNPAGGGN